MLTGPPAFLLAPARALYPGPRLAVLRDEAPLRDISCDFRKIPFEPVPEVAAHLTVNPAERTDIAHLEWLVGGCIRDWIVLNRFKRFDSGHCWFPLALACCTQSEELQA